MQIFETTTTIWSSWLLRLHMIWTWVGVVPRGRWWRTRSCSLKRPNTFTYPWYGEHHHYFKFVFLIVSITTWFSTKSSWIRIWSTILGLWGREKKIFCNTDPQYQYAICYTPLIIMNAWMIFKNMMLSLFWNSIMISVTFHDFTQARFYKKWFVNGQVTKKIM